LNLLPLPCAGGVLPMSYASSPKQGDFEVTFHLKRPQASFLVSRSAKG